MSRTTRTVLTAALLAVVASGLMLARYLALGDDIKAPTGPATWKVTLAVQGQSQGDARLITTTPPDFGRQHVTQEACQSPDLLHRLPEARHPERHYVLWTRRGGPGEGPFHARYEFRCVLDVRRPTHSMSRLAKTAYAPPAEGEHLEPLTRNGAEANTLATQAACLVQGIDGPVEQAAALFRFVDKDVTNEPAIEGANLTAAECLKSGSGDSAGKSRLLLALFRQSRIASRLVTGLMLARGQRDQQPHHWVEAWVDGRWLSYCPFHHHAEHVPSSYLVLGFGDTPIVRGKHVRDLRYAFLVERLSPEDVLAADPSFLHRLLVRLSLYMLPPAEQRLVEFLLLLPVAALIVCLFRNVIGLASFGTFAPALVGLAFRDLHSMPGLAVFVSIVLVGWVLRRVLDSYHLLQVPRTALLLSLVVVVLIGAVVGANLRELPATRYVALFPMIILTGMVERFWTLETEDSTTASFKTLAGTIVIAGSIALLLSLRAIVTHLFRYPETLGLVMAAQLLLGRYTGYRLSELLRFRDFATLGPKGIYVPSKG
jgi:hypothetical protein